MRTKKELPLIILKALEPFVNLKGSKFDIQEPGESLLTIVDKDENSNFYFTIDQYKLSQEKGIYEVLIRRIPRSQNDAGVYEHWVDINTFGDQFNKWVGLLEEYDKTASFYDDPILQSFKNEFYADFELIDDDVNVTPFSIHEILELDIYLETLHLKLGDFEEGASNTNGIEDIQNEILLLRSELTSKPKTWVFTKLVTIWGKIAKMGTKYIKEFLIEARKELTKELVKGVIEYTIKGN